jgi:hypothetical protein
MHEREWREPRRRLWPSLLPITEAGPRGARIKPAARPALPNRDTWATKAGRRKGERVGG